MGFLNFAEFQDYVTASYVVSFIFIGGLVSYIIFNAKKQHTRLKNLEKNNKSGG